MGQRYPICNANDVIRVLRRNDFVKVGQKGSHQKWRHADGRQVIVGPITEVNQHLLAH